MVNNYMDQRYLWNSMETQMTSIWTLPSVDADVAEYPAAVIFSVHLADNVLWLSAHPVKIPWRSECSLHLESSEFPASKNSYSFNRDFSTRTNALSQMALLRKYMNEFIAAIPHLWSTDWVPNQLRLVLERKVLLHLWGSSLNRNYLGHVR